jgi:lipoprotein-anchoring transpeptidase ErfK/SrfK
MKGLAGTAVLLAAASLLFLRGADDDFTPSWVATVNVAELAIYPALEAPEPSLRLPGRDDGGVPLVLLVDDVDVDGDRVQVHLPIRPNGSKGWVHSGDVTLARNDYRIRVELDDRMLVLTRAGDVVFRTPVGVGTDDTPTPRGTYYTKELVEPPDPDGLYGPLAYGLSGFSDSPGAVDFKGGNGQLGIHGTNDPSSIGEEVSHGCIRVPNDVIWQMASMLPIGTPVDIV